MRPFGVIPALSLALAGVLPAGAQTFNYVFSSCASGATMQVSFTVTPPVTTIPPPAYAYAYLATSATFTLTVNGASQTYSGPAGANIQYIPSTGPGVAAATELLFTVAPGPGVPNWSVNLQGAGSLLPNGLTAALPPISMWVILGSMHFDYISVGGSKRQFYYLDTFGSCGGSSSEGSNSGLDADKSLGITCDTPGCVSCGEPINLGTGNVFENVTDYQTAGPNKLAFIRYYNSMASSPTYAVNLGMNWRSNYDAYLRLSASSVIAERPDGQQVTFKLSSGAWSTDTDLDYKLASTGSTWTLTRPDDSVETYNAINSSEALPVSIRARNGYTQTLVYDAGNNLTTVTDSFNLQLSFAYSGNHLATVTTPDGLILTYGYTGNKLTSVSYSTTPVTSQTYVYENNSLPAALTGVIDENGNRYATWTYDSMGRATLSEFAGGAGLTRITYNDTDGSRTVTNALGAQTVYKFTPLQGTPKVTEIDQPATADSPAAVKKLTYDSNGYLASQTDANGNLTNYVNDVHGQPTSIVEAAGTPQARTTTVTYHSTFHLPVKIVQAGLTTGLTYDTNGQLLTKTLTDTTTTTSPYATGAQTRTWTYTWSNFLRTSIQKPRTDVTEVTTFTYDASGALTAFTNALGQATQVTQHLPGGLPQTVVDPNGVTTQHTYDARLRLLSSAVETAAGALTTTLNYDAAGNRTGVTLPDGSSVTDTFDAAHRLTRVTDLSGQSASLTLDALGDRTKSSLLDSSGKAQRMHSSSFDALGRLMQDVRGAGQTTSYTYDGNGNPLTITDPLKRATQGSFDALNRPVRITDPNKGVTTNVYDLFNRVTSVTDPNGGVTTYVYDGFGDLIERISPDSGSTVYHYDADGNITQSVDGSGAVVNHTYDALDRVLTTTYPADPAENVNFNYDQPAAGFGIGQLTSVTDAVGTLSRAFDERGNLLNETRVNGSATLVTAYTYDATGRITSITYPSGWIVVYTRDMMGRITAASAQPPDGSPAIPVVSNAGYQPFGPVNAMTFGNGVAETRSFDPDYRVTSLADAGAGPLQNLTYSYDASDNVTAIADGVTAANSQSFAYDVLNRLASAKGAYGSYSYTYDGAGNRLTESLGGSATNYSYAPHSNQLASVSAAGASQMIGYTKAGGASSFNPAAGSITNLAYNQAGRIAAVMAGSNPAVEYTYDAFNQRLAKTGASTTLYQYDQTGHLLEETDAQGNPTVDYIYLDSLPVATVSPAGAQVYFLHDDRLGTPQSATDGSQSVVWSASYGPFGEMSATPGLIVQNLRMPGQEFDPDTGLYHNGFRDYAPGWGRYLQSDPLGLAAGLNTYGYAGANPVNSVDPLGLLTGQDVSDAFSSAWSTVKTFGSDLASDVQVQWADEQADGLTGYISQLPCTTTLKRWYNQTKELYDDYEAVKDVVDFLDAVGNIAEDEGNKLIGLLPNLFSWGAKNSQYWGNERIPPPPQANDAINNGTWGNPNYNRTVQPQTPGVK